jgi:plastocyanin
MKGTLTVVGDATSAATPPAATPPPATPEPAAPEAPSGVELIANELSFNAATLSAKAGRVTLSMFNRSVIPHNIAIRGNGVDAAGPVVPRGGTSTVTVELAPGTYEFYCSVPGHAQAGMKGTLVVTADGATSPPPAAPTVPTTPEPGAEQTAGGVAGAATPPTVRARCTGPTFTLKGTVASVAADLRFVTLRVERVAARSAEARKRARSYVAKRVSVLLHAKTQFKRDNRPAAFTDLARGDRFSAEVRLCQVARRARLVAAVVSARSATSQGALELTASGVKFDKTVLRARAGKVTITMWNTSSLAHNVALRGRGVDVKGKLVGKGGTSTVTATLVPGRYEFYCSVLGHAEAGMKGTLVVTP